MPTVAYVKLQKFTENLAEKVFNLGSDTLKYAFTNTAPNAATNGALADLVEVSYANFSGRTATITSSAQTSGTYKQVLQDLTISFTGVAGPFQYIYLYSDTAAGDELIGYYDLGEGVFVITGNNVNFVYITAGGGIAKFPIFKGGIIRVIPNGIR